MAATETETPEMRVTRRVAQGSTLYVNVPAAWVKYLDLHHGDLIELSLSMQVPMFTVKKVGGKSHATENL